MVLVKAAASALALALVIFAIYAALAYFVRSLWLPPLFPPGILVGVTWMCFLTAVAIAASAPFAMEMGSEVLLFFLCVACPVAAVNLVGGFALAAIAFLLSFRCTMSDCSLQR